ncbi:MAG: class I SAM-dependent methyltransferase [Bacillota bacterium]|nr:class I SAM-dependent methyltransferase [Bacillota bacterium]
MEDYQDINKKTIDRWVGNGWKWGIPISHEEFLKAKNGDWDVVLTPTRKVPHEWFGDLKGKRVLGLASGGGQQVPIFAALGAEVTVLDNSPKQIESELLVAKREGYQVKAVEADMTKPLPFPDGYFDLIFQPVSFCYIREVFPIYKEVHRILKKGGVYLSVAENEINYLVEDETEERIVQRMPFDPIVDEAARRRLEESDSGMQFSHSYEEQLGGLLKAGFTIADLYEDTNGEGHLHELNVKTYIATKAIRNDG